jgi:serine/threonine protein phosphatase 1
MPVAISDWKPAPFDLKGETVFAIGDIHGCAAELSDLLESISTLVAKTKGPTRLVYLGDLINRGPDNMGVLRLWAEDERRRGVDRIDRLMGNHEIILLLAARRGEHADKAEAMWLLDSMGGTVTLGELQRAAGRPGAAIDRALLEDALTPEVVSHLDGMKGHLKIGNALFVHGGLDPNIDEATLLARPWTQFIDARWAWINRGFLDWKGGFKGTLVVHGHTPPPLHRAISGMEDPHVFEGDRLGLDGGSARTGIVTGAVIQDGRYRILKSGIERAPAGG